MKRITCAADIAAGLEDLVQRDPALRPVVARTGDVPLRLQAAGYAGLAQIIVSQMVSKASAAAIFARLEAAAGVPMTGEAVLRLGEDALFALGLSRAKARTLIALAEAERNGAIHLVELCALKPREAMARLTAIKGIGPWTGEVYLMFAAGHPDVFPVGDIALVNAVRHAFGHDTRLEGRELADFAERWSPWRSVAARLFWAYYARHMRRDALPFD